MAAGEIKSVLTLDVTKFVTAAERANVALETLTKQLGGVDKSTKSLKDPC